MKRIMLLFVLLVLGCTTSPRKQYTWTSLSEKGFTKNTLAVLSEAKGFEGNKGEDRLETRKEVATGLSSEGIQKIVLLGDTGCRLKESKYGNSYQNCKDGKDWIYQSVIEKISAENPDLIIHVGDYHYREQCSEGKECRQFTDIIGYSWRAWEQDFFAPSEKAFHKPWVFVRGNHEDCQRAYKGFKLLTEQTWPENCVKAERTEYLKVGGLLIVQLDTSGVSDREETPQDLAFWEKQFKDIETELAARKADRVWLVTHKPLVGLVSDSKSGLKALNSTLRKAFQKTNLAKKIEFMFGGHIHNTQFIRAEGFPKQVVIGNSGTALDDLNATRESILKNKIDGVKYIDFESDTKTRHSFGYALMSKTENGDWQLQFKDANGEVTFTSVDVKIEDSMNLKPEAAPKKKKKK